MYSHGELFMRSLKCYFGVCFPRFCATWEIKWSSRERIKVRHSNTCIIPYVQIVISVIISYDHDYVPRTFQHVVTLPHLVYKQFIGKMSVVNMGSIIAVSCSARLVVNHSLSHRWSISVLNTQSPEQNYRHFADYISKYIVHIKKIAFWITFQCDLCLRI